MPKWSFYKHYVFKIFLCVDCVTVIGKYIFSWHKKEAPWMVWIMALEAPPVLPTA